MTTSEEHSVIAALHAMEVRFTERLASIETEARAWRENHNELRGDIQRVADSATEAAKAVALTQAADKADLQREIRRVEDAGNLKTQRITIAIVVIAIAAAGRLGLNIFQLLA